MNCNKSLVNIIIWDFKKSLMKNNNDPITYFGLIVKSFIDIYIFNF